MTEAEMDNRIDEHSELDFEPVIITLTNGLRVANFSSNHSFEFEDGSILPAVSDELCTLLSMDVIENEYTDTKFDIVNPFKSIKLLFKPSNDVLNAIHYWHGKWLLEPTEVDIVIVPLPIITMLRQYMNWDDDMVFDSPFRTIRVVDRLTKKVSINKFCI